jgi:hypothetical protein
VASRRDEQRFTGRANGTSTPASKARRAHAPAGPRPQPQRGSA